MIDTPKGLVSPIRFTLFKMRIVSPWLVQELTSTFFNQYYFEMFTEFNIKSPQRFLYYVMEFTIKVLGNFTILNIFPDVGFVVTPSNFEVGNSATYRRTTTNFIIDEVDDTCRIAANSARDVHSVVRVKTVGCFRFN